MLIALRPKHRLTKAAILIAGLTGLTVTPVTGQTAATKAEVTTLLGSYLAGRVARNQHDTSSAADFYEGALARDQGNPALIEQAILMDATEGHFERASKLARQMIAMQPGHRMSRLILGLEEAKAGRWADALAQLSSSGGNPMSDLTSGLARAWVLAAQNDIKAANETLDGIKQAEFYVRYHRALINDLAGNRQEARNAFERIFRSESKVLRVALAYAQSASNAADQKLARTIIEDHIKKTAAAAVHPAAKALSERLRSNERTDLLVTNPVDGLSEVFFGLGEALASENNAGAGVGAVYLQLSLYLRPESPFALAGLANVYEMTKRYDAAITTYDRIPADSPLHSSVEIRKALNLNQLERVDEAKAVLDKLVDVNPGDVRPLDALGAIMRGHKRFQEAADYYTRILATFGQKPDKAAWTYYYHRGTCYERMKKWSLAEADLQKALKLAPDQPLVLNYLGYSWVDQNKNLKQGLALIEKAVNLKPDDGYIVDSLGWAHYRLGNYKEAAKWLERSVELKPDDPVLNDHLGDALWKVDRQREARFQWEQALTLKPEPEDAEKIRQKIVNGLPEKKAPPRVTKKGKEPARAELPKKQTRLSPNRPVVE